MSEAGFPRRDEDGRIAGAVDLGAMALAGLAVGVLALVLIDGVFAFMLGVGQFGRANGWIASVLPVWLFIEEFRSWAGAPGRIPAALVGALLAITTGLLVSGLFAGLPGLFSGGLGAAAAVVAYTLVWFYGVRWLVRRAG